VTLGLAVPRWATVAYDERPAIGRFEGEAFDPDGWKPRVPTAAFLRARADDTFWAARRVMAFTDAMIRAIVQTGQYSDPRVAQQLADVLIQRRNRIGQTFLVAVNPVVDVTLTPDGALAFENAAVAAGVAHVPASYTVSWAAFDNSTGTVTPVGGAVTVTDTRATAPAALPSTPGAFVKVQIAATGGPAAWGTPVDTYFRRTGSGWTLIGFERLP
jgi:hypothetical protein